MKTSSAILLAQLFALSTEARLWQKASRDLQEKRSDDGGDVVKSTRIVGGYEATEDRYSFAVSLQTSSHFCGGSLLAKDMVLSAAHCADGGSLPRYDVVIGRHDHDEYWDGDRVDVAREYIHPNYNEFTNNYDVMVVKLARSTRADVATIKLNSSTSKPSSGQPVTVVGWGVTESGYTSDELREVEVTAVSPFSCRSSYGFDVITDEMLCGGDPYEDSCQGDSGGALFLKGDSAEDDLQVGIVSWGYGCADRNYPGVYARVSSAYDWVRDIVCENSQDEDARSRYQCTGAVSGNSTPAPTPESTFVATVDDFDYIDDYSNDDILDDWWASWTNTVSSWLDSWWN
mmetsp:Transcript_759/g.1205  ORF Transcript_759/g.1205 Transcript_759/m.1205 type:complete len:344 (+) Transcript_759:265-1296(+)|eukprot:scaffold124_cov153-Skeletonema_menzelii.AAC.2